MLNEHNMCCFCWEKNYDLQTFYADTLISFVLILCMHLSSCMFARTAHVSLFFSPFTRYRTIFITGPDEQGKEDEGTGLHPWKRTEIA